MENCRNPDRRVVQRQVLYLGEISGNRGSVWCRSIEVLCGESNSNAVALFPADREARELDCEVVQIELRTLRLRRARQRGTRPHLHGPRSGGPVSADLPVASLGPTGSLLPDANCQAIEAALPTRNCE